jgi:hypothetical protein
MLSHLGVPSLNHLYDIVCGPCALFRAEGCQAANPVSAPDGENGNDDPEGLGSLTPRYFSLPDNAHTAALRLRAVLRRQISQAEFQNARILGPSCRGRQLLSDSIIDDRE